jgi:hypothetical protein
MTDHTSFIFDLPDKKLTNLEGSFYIKDGKIRLVLQADGTIPGYIHRLEGRNKRDGTACLFLSCALFGFGPHFDEYLVAETYLNQEITSFDQDTYIACIFELTRNSLPFFNQPWEYIRDSDVRKKQILLFRSQEDRWPKIQIDSSTTLIIKSGYSQQYSKIQYTVESSMAFEIRSSALMGRQTAFRISEAVASFYSIFCYKPVRVKAISLQVDAVNLITYFGKHAVQNDIESDLGAIVIEQSEIRDYSDKPLIQWIRDYGKYKIPSELLIDAQQINEEGLRFICLTRALEVFHKEFFIEKPTPGYLSQLHVFLVSKDLTNRNLKSFDTKDISLYQRLYDLLRSIFELLFEQSFRLKVGFLVLKESMENIAYNRNYYTHFTKKNKAVWTSEELAPINRMLLIFLKILFLKQSGFSDDAIKRTLGKWPNVYY